MAADLDALDEPDSDLEMSLTPKVEPKSDDIQESAQESAPDADEVKQTTCEEERNEDEQKTEDTKEDNCRETEPDNENCENSSHSQSERSSKKVASEVFPSYVHKPIAEPDYNFPSPTNKRPETARRTEMYTYEGFTDYVFVKKANKRIFAIEQDEDRNAEVSNSIFIVKLTQHQIRTLGPKTTDSGHAWKKFRRPRTIAPKTPVLRAPRRNVSDYEDGNWYCE